MHLHLPSGVFNKTFTFTKTQVPATETSYICQAFSSGFMNHTDEIHMIGSVPQIDNAQVMHHILVFGCTKKPGRYTLKAYFLHMS